MDQSKQLLLLIIESIYYKQSHSFHFIRGVSLIDSSFDVFVNVFSKNYESNVHLLQKKQVVTVLLSYPFNNLKIFIF